MYVSSLPGAFLFDDYTAITTNQRIGVLWPPWIPLSGTARPLTQWSFALNDALGGLTPWGYHVVNVILHLAAAVVLFDLVRRTLTLSSLAGRFGPAASWLAWTSAMLWMLHPLQTESAAYLAQRAELLAGLWALAALDAVVRGAGAEGRGWFLFAGLACLLGMASKPVAVMIPAAVLLYDRCLLAGSWRQAWAQRRGLYLGLAATWGILALLLIAGLGGKPPTAGFAVTHPTVLGYAATQPGVILHYLRLAVWPAPLCFDYGWPVARTLGAILPPALGLGLLLAGVGWWLRRDPAVGFWAAWGFVTLAPSSSVIPIADLAFEHRLYLPLAGFVVAAVLLGWQGLQRLAAPAAWRRLLAAGLVVPLATGWGWLTVRRLRDYRDEITLWRDTVAKRPENFRAHYNLGNALLRARRPEEAVTSFVRALALSPDSAKAHNNLAGAYLLLGQPARAAAHYQEALRLDPAMAEAHNNLGTIRLQEGRIEEAIAHFEAALRTRPDFPGARHNLVAAQARRRGRAPLLSPP